jgi:hypothetical protein
MAGSRALYHTQQTWVAISTVDLDTISAECIKCARIHKAEVCTVRFSSQSSVEAATTESVPSLGKTLNTLEIPWIMNPIWAHYMLT